MGVSLQILLLVNNPADAGTVQQLLKKAEIQFECRIATSRDQYLLALDQFQPDLILADNSLPLFNATEAMEIIHEKSLYIPFILVTAPMSEEFASGIIKLGADDYILKDRLTRLPSAIDHASKERSTEKEKLEAIQKLKQSEGYLNAIFENASEGFILTDRYGIVKAFNSNAKKYVLLNTNKELESGQQLSNFIDPRRAGFVKKMIAKVLTGETIQFERLYEGEGVNPLWLHFSKTPVWENGKIEGICITTRDITAKKESEDTHRSMEQEILHQKVAEQKKITRAIISAEERQRNYIAQELHDNINQILVGTKIYLGNAGKNNAKLEALIKYPMELIDSCMDEIRLLSRKHVTPLKDIDVKDLVQSLLDNLDKNLAIHTNFAYDVSHRIDDDLNINIYRIIQEQVNNIVKHANAHHLSISIKGGDKFITIVIADDGHGFDLHQKRKGIGISNMLNRIESFNGEVVLESSAGKGCKIQITIPY